MTIDIALVIRFNRQTPTVAFGLFLRPRAATSGGVPRAFARSSVRSPVCRRVAVVVVVIVVVVVVNLGALI